MYRYGYFRNVLRLFALMQLRFHWLSAVKVLDSHTSKPWYDHGKLSGPQNS